MQINRFGLTLDGRVIGPYPWIRRLGPAFSITTPPSFTGTPNPGQTLTAVAGDYDGPSYTSIRFIWTQFAGNTLYQTSYGPTFLLPENSPPGTVFLEEEIRDENIITRKLRSLVATIGGTTSAAPVFETNPILSSNGNSVGVVIQKTAALVTGVPTPSVTTAWYRGSTLIPDVVGNSYTTVQADGGQSITVIERGENASGVSFSNRSNPIAIEAVVSNVVNVSNSTELQTALTNAVAGQTIVCTTGTYSGVASLNNKTFNPRITIRGTLVSGSEPLFTATVPFQFTNINGFNMEGLRIVHTARDASRTQGNVAVPNSSSRSMSLSGCSNFKINNCYSGWAHEAYRIDNATDYEFCYNTAEDFGKDALSFHGRHANFNIYRNLLWKSFMQTGAGQKEVGREPNFAAFDCVPTYTGGVYNATEGSAPCANGRYEFNYSHTSQWTATDTNDIIGIDFSNQRSRAVNGVIGGQNLGLDTIGHDNIKINNNYFEHPSTKSISLEGCKNFELKYNIFRQPPATGTAGEEKPRLWFNGTKFTNVVVENNYGPQAPQSVPASGVTQNGNNWTVNTGEPTGYVALFPEGSSKNVGQWGLPSVLAAPVITANPTITGSVVAGSTLNAAYATVTGNPAPALSGLWYKDGVATSVTTLNIVSTTADVGKKFKFRQTAANSQGTVFRDSAEWTITAVPTTALSRRMPATTEDEWNAWLSRGYITGDGMQKFHHSSNCLGKPLRAYGVQDTGLVWSTYDGGKSWRAPRCVGLYSYQGHGVVVDPINPDRLIAHMGGNYSVNQNYGGFYFSADGGDTFTGPHVVNISKSRRGGHAAIAYDMKRLKDATNPAFATHWFGIAGARTGDSDSVSTTGDRTSIRMGFSTNGGATWTTHTDFWNENTYGRAEFAVGDPNVAGRYWISTTTNLVRVDNAYTATGTSKITLTLVSASGATGRAARGPGVWNANGSRMSVYINGQGLQEYTASSGAWASRSTVTAPYRMFVSPYDYDWIIGTRAESDSPSRVYFCKDFSASNTFIQNVDADYEKRPGITTTTQAVETHSTVWFQPNRTSGSTVIQEAFLAGRQVSPGHANNWWRTENGGRSWVLANEGYCGANMSTECASISMFHPTNKDIFSLPMIDKGQITTANGGKWFTFSGMNNEVRDANSFAHPSVVGVALEPGAGTTADPHVYWISVTEGDLATGRSDNSGPRVLLKGTATNWTSVPTYSRVKQGTTTTNIPSQQSGGVYINPANRNVLMWGRWRSINGGTSWSAMADLPTTAWSVGAMSTNTSGTNAFWAMDFGSDVKTIKRSTNNGADWTTVITLPGDNRPQGGRFGLFYAHPTDINKIYTADSGTGAKDWAYLEWDVSGTTPTSRRINIFGATTANKPSSYGTSSANFSLGCLAIDNRNPSIHWVGTAESSGYPNLFRCTDHTANVAFEDMSRYVAGTGKMNGLIVHPLTGECIAGAQKGVYIIAPSYTQAGKVIEGLPYEAYVGSPTTPTTPDPEVKGFTTQPSLSGNAPMGSTLTLNPGVYTGTPTPTYEWYRGTSTTPLNTTGLTRVTGTDDVTNTITVIVKLTYSDGTVISSNRTNGITVTAATTPPTTGWTTPGEQIMVSSVTQLRNALVSGNAGKVIRVAPGNYATSGTPSTNTFAVDISNVNWSSAITIEAEDRNNKPVFTGNGMQFTNCNNFRIRGINFDHIGRSTYKEGGVSVPHDGSNSLELVSCNNFLIEHCWSNYARWGIKIGDCDNGVVKYNTITKCGMDCMNNTGKTDNVYMHHNYIHDTLIYTGAWTPPDNFPSSGDRSESNRAGATGWHPDFTQLWTLSGTGGRISNFTYKRNYLDTQQNTSMHGVYSGNQRVRNASNANRDAMIERYGSLNLLIEGNRIGSNHVQGTCFESVYSNMLVQNNIYVQTASTSNDQIQNPAVHMLGEANYYRSNQVTVRNNIFPRSAVAGDGTASASTSGNLENSTATTASWWVPLVTSGTGRNVGQDAPVIETGYP